jgi:recombinational DNA repair protein (RecF pathway)
MGQLRFSRCLRCGSTYQHEVRSGYGPLYCDQCRPEIQRAKAKERQRKYRQRKSRRL